MPSAIRSFIAFDLNENIKSHIRDLQNELKALDCDIRWVEPHNAHLTLKFLGNVEQENIPRVIKSLISSVGNLKPFLINTGHWDAFPETKHPQIIWLEVQPEEKLRIIVADIEENLSVLGYKKESRPYQAHITLGRVKSGKNVPALKDLIETAGAVKSVTQTIDRISLYRSTLTRNGPTYEVIEEVPLKDGSIT